MKKVTIQDQKFIDEIYKESGSELGYNSFCGTYSTCIGHKEELYFEKIKYAFFYILVNPENKEKSIVPLYFGKEPRETVPLFKEYYKNNNFSYCLYIDQKFVQFLKDLFPIQQEGDSEHEAIYPIERFSRFSEVDTQKRRANIFFCNNQYDFKEYEERFEGGVIELVDYWELHTQHPTEYCDNIITRFFTENYKKLPIKGFVLLSNNVVAGYVFGEVINYETFVVNVIKARMDIKGIYQALMNLVSNHEALREVKFINYTNLTNVEGLREMKLRLKPIKFIIPWFFN